MAGSQITFQQYQSPSLHEAGHALIARVLGRKLKELSILNDEFGSGSVCREVIDAPGQSAMEEIAIALAGEEAPYLWNSSWVTPCEHDRRRIEDITQKYFRAHDADQLSEAMRPCVQSALSQLREVLAVLAEKLSSLGKLSGDDAEAIIRDQSPADVALDHCIAEALAKLLAPESK